MAEKNIEDYGIGMMPAEDYRGAVAVLSVLLGAQPFGTNVATKRLGGENLNNKKR